MDQGERLDNLRFEGVEWCEFSAFDCALRALALELQIRVLFVETRYGGFLLFLSPNIVEIHRMAVERTISIIKPDAVAKNVMGEIYSRFEKAGLSVVAAKMKHLSQAEAEGFYAVHSERPFFKDLVSFMTSGPVMIQVLEGEEAIAKNRELMGATNPAEAAAGTIRADFAASLDENAVHGSDAPETAAAEIKYFFGDNEVCPRTR